MMVALKAGVHVGCGVGGGSRIVGFWDFFLLAVVQVDLAVV